MATKRQNKLLGVCASLGLHGLVAAIAVFSLSGNAVIPRDLGKLDFVWVSLATKHEPLSSPVQEDHGQKTPLTTTQARLTPEASAIRDIRMDEEADVPSSRSVVSERPAIPSGLQTVAYAAAGGHFPVSDARRSAVTSGIVPVFSDARPLYRENPPPGYPEMARQQGYEGIVIVAAEILDDGRVGKTVISKSSGYAILDQTAVDAVKAWKFEPAKKSGIPYKTWAELPIKFTIRDNNSQS